MKIESNDYEKADRTLVGLVLLVAFADALFAQPASGQPLPDPRTMHLVYKLPDADQVKVRENVKFGTGEGRDLFLDVYQPAELKEDEQRATILFISGGENVRDWPQYREYGRLAAAKGFVAIVPDKRFPRGQDGVINGTADMETLRKFLMREGPSLGIDPKRIAHWIFSGGGQLGALGLHPPKSDEPPPPKCVVIFYAVVDFAPDLVKTNPSLMEYSPVQAIKALGQAAPPIFLARAGRDMPPINLAIGNFVDAALTANAPVTLVNYPNGRHAFDALNDTEESRAIIKESFEFIHTHTKAP